MKKVYIVINTGNEIDSVWLDPVLAQARAKALGRRWAVEEWPIEDARGQA